MDTLLKHRNIEGFSSFDKLNEGTGLVNANGAPLLTEDGKQIGKIEYNRLSDIDFTDLFFSEDGESFIRGVDDGQSDGPISEIPESVLHDLEILHQLVCEKGRSLDEFFMDYDGMRFRVSKIDEITGVWYALRRAKWPIPKLNSLGGIPPRVIEYLGHIGKPSMSGLIIVSGATSQGKTTTASALLTEYLTHYGDVAVTVEDPVELPLSGPHGRYGRCFQTQVNNGDFADAMKKTMRRAPRYIFLGEVRSAVEASVALRAAINGHLVITTIHAGSCIQALDAMIKFVAGSESVELARSNLADGLAGVINQRFIRYKGKAGRSLKVEYMFPGKDQGIRSLIRSGKTEQLSTAIAQQHTRVNNGLMPLDN